MNRRFPAWTTAPSRRFRATSRSAARSPSIRTPPWPIRRRAFERPDEPLPAPTDITPRTEYPRPWLGGKWTLRDIVDYEITATFALLDAAADNRETLLRQIYQVNRNTVEAGKKGEIGQDREMQMRARTKVIDVLWIMIPLMFLVAAVTFWATRQYGGVQDRDAVRKESVAKLDPPFDGPVFCFAAAAGMERDCAIAEMSNGVPVLVARKKLR